MDSRQYCVSALSSLPGVSLPSIAAGTRLSRVNVGGASPHTLAHAGAAARGPFRAKAPRRLAPKNACPRWPRRKALRIGRAPRSFILGPDRSSAAAMRPPLRSARAALRRATDTSGLPIEIDRAGESV
jgi:hypothetical protein